MIIVAIPISIPIVVMIIPVPLAVPATLIFIPPAMVAIPALLSGFMEFMTCTFRLLALRPVMFDGFMEPVIGVRNSALAIVILGA